TVPTYIRVVPPSSSATAKVADGTSATTSASVFTAVADGSWSNPSTWLDQALNPGVPGANDFATIGTHTIDVSGVVEVKSLTLNGATLVNPSSSTQGFGDIDVDNDLSIVACTLVGNVLLSINLDTSVGDLVNESNIQFVADPQFPDIFGAL